MKLIFGVLIIAASIYLGVQFVPPYFENYQFGDFVKNEATLETYTSKPEADIRDTVFKKAQDLDIPISKDAIKVQRQGVGATGSVSIQAPYTVHLNLPGYPVDLHFDASNINKSPF
jgi:hypothetical protein